MSTFLSRAIVCKANTGDDTATKLHDHFEAPVTAQRVRQLLSDTEHLEWTRLKPAPRLLSRHKVDRLSWARAKIAVWLR